MQKQENIEKLLNEIENAGDLGSKVEHKLAQIVKRKYQIDNIIKTYALESTGKSKTVRISENILNKLESEAQKNNITIVKYVNIILASYALEDD